MDKIAIGSHRYAIAIVALYRVFSHCWLPTQTCNMQKIKCVCAMNPNLDIATRFAEMAAVGAAC